MAIVAGVAIAGGVTTVVAAQDVVRGAETAITSIGVEEPGGTFTRTSDLTAEALSKESSALFVGRAVEISEPFEWIRLVDPDKTLTAHRVTFEITNDLSGVGSKTFELTVGDQSVPIAVGSEYAVAAARGQFGDLRDVQRPVWVAHYHDGKGWSDQDQLLTLADADLAAAGQRISSSNAEGSGEVR